MGEDTMESNLSTLKDMVLDEQKLITYVYLSKELCIHVNQSKSLLGKFVEEVKKKQPGVKLNVCYIISGISEDSKARTTVSSEDEIENIRKTFKNVFFEHIYSVSKGQACVDNVAFMAINKFEDFSLCSGLIKSNSCIKRTSEEIGNLKSNSQDIAFVDQKPTNPVQMKIKEKSGIQINGHGEPKNVTKVCETKSEPTIKTEIPSPKKESYGSSSKQKFNTKKNGNKTQKGIAGFFNRSNSAPNKKVVNDTIDSSSGKQGTEIKEPAVKQETSIKETIVKQKKSIKETTKPEESVMAVEKMEVDEEEIIKEKEEVKKETKKGNSKDKSKHKTVIPNNKNAKLEKKRKRVLHISDSESEDEKDPFADDHADSHESEDEIPPTPSVNTVKIASGLVNPKKKRKVVDKTYTDEEGYILTKKEVIYESCSDNEEEGCAKENVHAQPVIQVKQDTSPKGKKNGTKNTKKKISPPQKGKQATLMNFFKKA